MLTEERHQIIKDMLEQETIVKLQTIVDKTQASESTIRRDLSHLEAAGTLVRVHGGAKQNFAVEHEPSVKEKLGQYQLDKVQIGKYAAQLIQDNDFIFIDAGTTTLAMLPYIKAKNITVVTNGLEIAHQLAELKVQSILIGGLLKPTTLAIIGSVALNQLKQYQFSKVFMGTNGIDPRFGLTTPDIEEATIKQTAIAHANQVYVLADSSKFNKISFCHIADLEDATIVTNALDPALKEKYSSYTKIKEAD